MRALIVALVIASATTASAANLINEDGKPYKVSFLCDGVSSHLLIRAKTVHEDAFRQGCVVTIEKRKHPQMSALSDANIVIRKGRLVQAAFVP